MIGERGEYEQVRGSELDSTCRVFVVQRINEDGQPWVLTEDDWGDPAVVLDVGQTVEDGWRAVTVAPDDWADDDDAVILLFVADDAVVAVTR